MKQMMIRSVVLSLFGLLFCFVLAAQNTNNKKSAEEIASKQTEMMTKNLSLTPDQVTKVKSINLDYAKKMKNASDSDKKRLESEKDAELKNVLTAEQYKNWEANKQTWINDLKKVWSKTKDKVGDTTNDVKNKVDDLTK